MRNSIDGATDNNCEFDRLPNLGKKDKAIICPASTDISIVVIFICQYCGFGGSGRLVQQSSKFTRRSGAQSILHVD